MILTYAKYSRDAYYIRAWYLKNEYAHIITGKYSLTQGTYGLDSDCFYALNVYYRDFHSQKGLFHFSGTNLVIDLINMPLGLLFSDIL